MAQRPDLEMIRRYVKLSKRWGFADEEFVKWAMTLPFFYMADKKLEDQPYFKSDFSDLDQLRTEHVYDDYVMAHTYDSDFYENSDYVKGVDKAYVAKTEQWGVIRKVPKTKDEDLFLCHVWTKRHPPESFRTKLSEMVGGDGSYEFFAECFVRTKDGAVDLDVSIKPTPLYKELASYKGFTTYLMDEGVKLANLFFLGAHFLMVYLKHGPKHLVEVTPAKKAKTSPALQKNRPWVGATGPRILLLDRMPTTQSESTGTHASPKPHRRRGHWKTLSHPRFRHHPQYGKKIYVKPSFVGPRQATYEGNIYRLVEPLDPLVAI